MFFKIKSKNLLSDLSALSVFVTLNYWKCALLWTALNMLLVAIFVNCSFFFMQIQAYEWWGKPEWGKTQQYKMRTQAQEVAIFSDASLSQGKLAEQPPRWYQTDFKLPWSDIKGKTESIRIIFSIQAAVQGPNYLIWNAEQRMPGLYKSQKLKLVWKGLPG